MRHPDYEFRARTYYGKKKHRMKEKTPSMTKRTLLYKSIDHTEELQETAPGNPAFHPLHFNPCKIPYGVIPQIWVDVMIEIYCRAYGLLERGKQLMAETFYSLYEEQGVFAVYGQPGWEKKVSELSANVTFTDAYKRMEQYKKEMDDGTSSKGRGGNDTKDAYSRLLERLSAFSRPYSIERKLFGESDGMGIDELIGADDVTVLESKGLESTFRSFIFGVITAGKTYKKE